MATNPMQRKSRNSFLLGMFLTLIITGIVIALLGMQLMKKIEEDNTALANLVKVCVLKQNVKSGQVLTEDMFTVLAVDKGTVPTNATSSYTSLSDFSLTDKAGNLVYSDSDGLYFLNGNTKTRILQEDETEQYYTQSGSTKNYIELNSVPLVAKVDMKTNTVITSDLVSRSDNVVTADVRREEYNMIVLPIDISTGDYVDIRIMFPNGQNYIVVSKKEVEVPVIGISDSQDTIWMNLSEDEILSMSSAIVEAYRISGAKLYATKYTDAGIQDAATPTYSVNNEVANEISANPNILQTAKDALFSRYNLDLRNNFINPLINSQENGKSNVEQGMESSISNSKESRQEYLDGLESSN